MRAINIAFTCIIFALLQMLVAPRIALGNVSPDFMLLLVAYFAIDRKAERGAPTEWRYTLIFAASSIPLTDSLTITLFGDDGEKIASFDVASTQ